MREPCLRRSAVVIGLVLAAVFCALTPYNNIERQNTPLAGGHFPLDAFACLLVLLLAINPILSRIRESWRLHSHEVLLIWSMVTVATGIAYTGLFRTFIINITTPGWFRASAGAGGPGEVIAPLAAAPLFPMDPQVVRTLYDGLEGGRDMGWLHLLQNIPWGEWLVPMLWWGLFIVLVFTAMMGLMGLFTHQWIENEKMNFPLLKVPEILGEEAEQRTLGRYISHRYFIIGLTIPVVLHLLNGLHSYYPQVPQIPALILAQPYVPREGILSGFYKFKIFLYPAFIGFAYLTSGQISFSLWFFFIMGGLLPGLLQVVGWRLPAAALGTTFGPVLSQVEEMQMLGAFGVYFLFIVWLARHHLKLVALSILRGKSPGGETWHGLLAPQPAAFLFLGGFAGLVAWMRIFGADLISAVLFLCVCFMLQLVTARLICQGGLPFFTLTAAPSDGFLAMLNSSVIAPASLFLGAVIQKAAFLDMRESLMPSLFHSSRLADGSHPMRRFLIGIAGSVAVALLVTFVAMMALYYKFGISSLPDDWAVESTRRVYENVSDLLTHPEGPKQWSIIFTTAGAVFTALLIGGYHRFIWWPFHPIGYLTTYSSAMRLLWFSYLIGWLCNVLVLRYGGITQYREARRLFVGLIVGDILMAGVWLIVGLFSYTTYHVLPL